MLDYLEELRKDVAKRQSNTRIREGSTVKGHWRRYKNGRTIWIEKHERAAHTVRFN